MSLSNLAVAGFGLFIGIIVAWFILKQRRRPFETDVPAITWEEKPLPVWKQDGFQTVYISIHALSIFSMAIFFLLDQSVPSAVFGSTRVMNFSLCFVWVIAGAVMSFYFLYPYAGRMPMAVFSNAFARGLYVGDWACFSHFHADPTSRIITLYAARSPEVVRVAWGPNTDELFNDVLSILKSVLPEDAPTISIPWVRTRGGLMGVLLLFVLPILVGAVSIFLSSTTWSWIYYTAAAPVLMLLGSTIIRKFELN
jgi:hypothetical protein